MTSIEGRKARIGWPAGLWLLVTASLLVGGATVGDSVPMGEVLRLLDVLRDVAAILLGVSGVWAALIFRARFVVEKGEPRPPPANDDKPDDEVFRHLSAVIFASTGILGLIVLAETALPIVRRVSYFANSAALHAIGFVAVLWMAVAYVMVLIGTLIPLSVAIRNTAGGAKGG